jgi:YD repeat-containing protein
MINQMRSFISTLFCLLLAQFVFAQSNPTDFLSMNNFTPPSPDAATLGRYGEIPVSYATGVPSISVPLYTIKSRKLSLPLSLSYHAGGIKVEDIASTAGLGWALNAGGCISRNIVGKADQVGMWNNPIYGYKDRASMESYYPSGSGDTNYYYLTHLANGNTDAQSDIYDINTPSFTGRFVYDIHTKQLRYTPVDKQLNISWNATDTTYTIIDDDGVKYIFGEKEYTQGQFSKDITAWYITYIISADGTDTMTLKYIRAADFTDVFMSRRFSCIATPDFGGIYSGVCPSIPNIAARFDSTENYVIYYRKLIDSIKFSNGYVKFNYASDRLDPVTDRLSSITVGTGSRVVSQFQLVHSYFISPGTNDRAAKRLRLDQLITKDSLLYPVDKYSFFYDTTYPMPRYYGSYDGTTPHTKTGQYDLWGYYNGSGTNGTYPAGFRNYIYNYLLTYQYSPDPAILSSYDGHSADRYPNPQYTKSCMLTTINYPTGGSTYFEYENNKIDNNNSNKDYTGGLRIKRMINYSMDLSVRPIVKTFAYGDSTGTGISIARVIPDDFYYSNQTINLNHIEDIQYYCIYNNFYISSNPTTAINYYNGSPVFYDKVTEYEGYPGDNTGKTDYTFLYTQDSVFNDPNSNKYWNMSTDKSWARGQPLSTKVYRKDGTQYTLVKETDNSYTDYGSSRVKVGYVCELMMLDGIGTSLSNYIQFLHDYGGASPLLNYYEYLDIVLVYGVKKLSETDVIDYANGSVTARQKFLYESTSHLYPTKTISYTSKGDSLIEVMKYPQDKALISGLSAGAASALDSMVAHNIRNVAAETESWRNTILLRRNRIEFTNWNSSGRFYEQYRDQQVMANPMEKRISYNSYDDKGNLTCLSKYGGKNMSYIWDYSKTYPIASADNAAANEIAFTSFESDGGGNWSIGNSLRSATHFTGNLGYDLSNGNITLTGLTSGKSYVVTYWSQNGSSKMVNGSSGTSVASKLGWTLFSHTLSSTSATVSGTGVIDELRIYPSDALMTSYTFSPLIGVISSDQPNGIVTYYEYDRAGRLARVRDADNNIIKTIGYHYQDTTTSTANWQFTGTYVGLTGGMIQKQEKDINPSSPTYNVTKWILGSITAVSPTWVSTGITRCLGPGTMQYQTAYKDQNLYSSSYGKVYWQISGTSCACSNMVPCNGPGQKVVNGCCETGIKVYTNYYYDSGTNICTATYHYEWSDGSWSSDQLEMTSGECPEGS